MSDTLADVVERLYAALVRRARRESPEPSMLTPTQRLALSVAVDTGPLRLGALAQRIFQDDLQAARLQVVGERVAIVLPGRPNQLRILHAQVRR